MPRCGSLRSPTSYRSEIPGLGWLLHNTGSKAVGTNIARDHLENPLAKKILDGSFAPKERIRVDVKDGRMVFEKG